MIAPTLDRQSPPPRSQFIAVVAENLPLCREHYKLILRLEAFPQTEPGQFVQVACRDMDANYSPETELDWQPGMTLDLEGRELMSPLALLRRPFSLAGRRDGAGGVELDLIHRIVGVGTDWMSRLAPGDQVNILGPLGNRFTLPAAGQQAILVGGGVGIPPMLYLAEKVAGQDAVAFCGALTRELLPLTIASGVANPGEDSFEPQPTIVEFARYGVRSVISTDDAVWGFRGFVTQALEAYLEKAGFRVQGSGNSLPTSLNLEPRTLSPLIYTCGPEPMMKRVAQIAAARGIECQIAVERAMACGMGTCQSCCIRLKREEARDGRAFAGRDWIYKLACTDGPVFKGSDLLW
jgi:dihydroorotate dehydrogenase electron transfer subunit